jgi:rSAM/selenodomain-associated transferase 2
MKSTMSRTSDPVPAADSRPPVVSIIVPVFNEAVSIEAFLESVRRSCARRAEIIVVDGGSTDATATLAQPLCDCLVKSPKGRAVQMNAGARRANAPVFWFLHADSQLPRLAVEQIRNELTRNGHRWGHFEARLSGSQFSLRIVERLMNWRSRLTGIATGDQGLFVTRELFDSIGGFPDIALMEDIAMSRKLKAVGRPVCLSQQLVTSSRRWEENGILRTIVLMWKLRLLYFAGVHPDKLAQMYYGRGG